ncbi:MAG: hypothetical protein ACFFED_02300 [Candidatus Thorarchaeota archaeon]
MNPQLMQSPLTDFTDLILQYLREIWDSLLFIAASSGILVILIGAILMFVGVKVGKLTGQKLILGGIILSVIVVYFVMHPPDFVLR